MEDGFRPRLFNQCMDLTVRHLGIVGSAFGLYQDYAMTSWIWLLRICVRQGCWFDFGFLGGITVIQSVFGFRYQSLCQWIWLQVAPRLFNYLVDLAVVEGPLCIMKAGFRWHDLVIKTLVSPVEAFWMAFIHGSDKTLVLSKKWYIGVTEAAQYRMA
ncbi:hypothetical protein LRAMOSA03518 [Lichtheimia ramosa]|uniref:Uncharacterized protein n=1 Tax=Lichtheimia ramosa TaxID=688394 RepID=A0A077WVC9_9FUNG|nr:hypothetical protein LRAMOSA03518 [Lichtheimia ramosa]